MKEALGWNRAVRCFLVAITVMAGVALGIPMEAMAESSNVLPFTDVSTEEWSYPYISYAYQQGIMSGTSGTTFAPDIEVSRAMAVQVLYALEGKPETIRTYRFTDLSDEWYQDAVSWAALNGIIAGTGNGSTFSPDAPISREQIVLILKKYAAYKGYDTSASKSLSEFSDWKQVSGYAIDAMQWAVGAGVISGQGSDVKRIAPQDGTKRAEFAAIMKSFNEKVATSEEELTDEVTTGSVGSQLLYIGDHDDYWVNVESLTKNQLGMITLELSVKNNTASEMTAFAKDVYINGYSVKATMADDIMPGVQTTLKLRFTEKDLLASKISKIGNIEFSLVFTDADDHETLYETDLMTVRTNQYWDVHQVDYDKDTSHIILKEEGITIYQEMFYNSVPEKNESAKLRLYVRNDSERAITLGCKDMSMNGKAIKGIVSQTILPGKKAVTDIRFTVSKLEAEGITKCETLKTKFNFWNYDAGYNYTTGPVSIDLTAITKTA